MSCEQYHDALTDVAAGGPVPAGLEEHLAACEACREELAALREALSAADAEMTLLARAEPSAGLRARIREAAAQAGPRPEWRFGWIWPLTAAAAALLVALATWMGRPPSPAPAVETRSATAPAERRPAETGIRTREALDRTAAPPAAVPSAPAPAVAVAGIAGRRGRSRLPTAAPEVLVPQGEAEALLRFAAIVCRDRHTPGALATVGRPSTDLAEPPALVIEPLEIVPLDAAGTPGT